MQTVLVAGGAGFIGTHLCQSLLKDGYKVICVDNFLTSDRKNIQNFLNNPNFVLIEQDVTKALEIDENVDFVFHLASPASPNKKSPKSYMNLPLETLLVNSTGTKNLLDLAKEKNAKFLYASTSEIYGDPAISPQPESYFGNVNPNGVRSVYDEGKRFGEAITMAYFRKYGLNVRITRIFNTYGPLMQVSDGRVVSDFINQALKNQPITVFGKGTQTRSLCFIDDMIKGLMLAMFSQDLKSEVINLGGLNELSVIDIANTIKKMINSTSEIVFEDLPEDDPKVRKPDISKAKKLLNWEPKVSLEEGLLETIEYFKSL